MYDVFLWLGLRYRNALRHRACLDLRFVLGRGEAWSNGCRRRRDWLHILNRLRDAQLDDELQLLANRFGLAAEVLAAHQRGNHMRVGEQAAFDEDVAVLVRTGLEVRR